MASDTSDSIPTELVLVIDDEPQIRRVVRNALKDISIRVAEAATAAEGLDAAAAGQPALIILDLGLPDTDGADLCRDLRTFTKSPIVVLSARHSDREKEKLLDAGADDYVTKPFSTIELTARIRAHLRRAAAAAAGTGQPAVITVGALTIDLARRTVQRDGIDIHLTPTEWKLLRALIAHGGRTLTHAQLFQAVWSGNAAGDAQQYLRVYVGQLRRKLELDPIRPRLIRTEPAVGYRFETGE